MGDRSEGNNPYNEVYRAAGWDNCRGRGLTKVAIGFKVRRKRNERILHSPFRYTFPVQKWIEREENGHEKFPETGFNFFQAVPPSSCGPPLFNWGWFPSDISNGKWVEEPFLSNSPLSWTTAGHRQPSPARRVPPDRLLQTPLFECSGCLPPFLFLSAIYDCVNCRLAVTHRRLWLLAAMELRETVSSDQYRALG